MSAPTLDDELTADTLADADVSSVSASQPDSDGHQPEGEGDGPDRARSDSTSNTSANAADEAGQPGAADSPIDVATSVSGADAANAVAPLRNASVRASLDAMNLRVGTRLQLTLRQGGRDQTYYCPLVGYVIDEFLLVRVPLENGLPLLVSVGQVIRVRVFSGLSVFSFVCDVETASRSPRNTMQLSFPDDITVMSLRTTMRVPVDMPATIGSDTSGTLSDLSEEGAQVTAAAGLGAIGERMSIGFSFPVKPANREASLRVDAVICSIRHRSASSSEPDLADYGLRFEGIAADDLLLLQNHVYDLQLHKIRWS